VFNKLVFGAPAHQHPDPARRAEAVRALPADSPDLARLLGEDPEPQVRIAAALRCADLALLGAALKTETEAEVRAALASSLAQALTSLPDAAAARAAVADAACSDAVRAEVVRPAGEAGELQRAAIQAIADEAVLVDLALTAASAPLRQAAAERVASEPSLHALFDAAKDKDRGVARIARQRLDAIHHRARQAAAADALIAQAEALVAQPGPIVMAAVELDRRWQALDLGDDDLRRSRWDAASERLRQRFDREVEQQRQQRQLEQRVEAVCVALPSTEAAALPALRATLAALGEEAVALDDRRALERLAQAKQQLSQLEQAAPLLATAEALVAEAEALAAGTSIDDAQLPARWHALDAAARTPALWRRFETALRAIEQRRLAQMRAQQQEQGGARQRLHALLHAAEQALAAGHVQDARAAADEARALKPVAGLLPKPTVQRLGRVVQQIGDLERWQKFGQQTAREQLCERAEALLAKSLPPAEVAREVQALRTEWKALDAQHAGVPKPLWERFDTACEKAYAPAAKHFAEVAAQHKEARTRRQQFVDAVAAQVEGRLSEPRDWRAIERWLRETDAVWHGGELGSVEPGAWKKLDARMKAAVAPARDALNAARAQAKAERQALIAEAEAIAADALAREAPGRVRELQSRWQAQAKGMTLAPRDERALWERFRAACNQVFESRDSARKAGERRRQAEAQRFESLCEQAEALSASAADDAALRQARRELQAQWQSAQGEVGAPPAALEARFRKALAGADDALRRKARVAEAAAWQAAWQALLDKARLCEELDVCVRADADAARDAAAIEAVRSRWAALPPLTDAWEKALCRRRDAACEALSGDENARYDHLDRIDAAADARRDALLEIELTLHVDSPPDLNAQRMAVQVKRLRGRFKGQAAGDASAEALLLSWCAEPGVAEERDWQRVARLAALLRRAPAG
jgi:hypothetical protein